MNGPEVTPQQVERWLSDGADRDAIVKVLMASGAWTEEGAREIVSTFAPGGGLAPGPVEEAGWPGPLEEIPPLFAS